MAIHDHSPLTFTSWPWAYLVILYFFFVIIILKIKFSIASPGVSGSCLFVLLRIECEGYFPLNEMRFSGVIR